MIDWFEQNIYGNKLQGINKYRVLTEKCNEYSFQMMRLTVTVLADEFLITKQLHKVGTLIQTRFSPRTDFDIERRERRTDGGGANLKIRLLLSRHKHVWKSVGPSPPPHPHKPLAPEPAYLRQRCLCGILFFFWKVLIAKGWHIPCRRITLSCIPSKR